MTTFEEFEALITALTAPINDQLPRPWITDLSNPLKAKLFIVGMNQAKGYSTERLSHSRHLDGLFNRHGESCRGIYAEMTEGSPSPTRKNTDRLRRHLAESGIADILETNVICYSTPMSADLRLARHSGGAARGSDIFRILLQHVAPRVVIAHGTGTRNELSKLLGVSLPMAPSSLVEPAPMKVGDMSVFVIPSLAPPQWNHWQPWSTEYLRAVAKAAARTL